MNIDHIAVWVADLEKMKDFYTFYFGGIPGQKYFNPKTQFSSYFISFDTGCRLELMHRPSLVKTDKNERFNQLGIVHFAISAGSEEEVDTLTEKLREAGYGIIGEPRTTGDGYYESVALDPEGNQIEITI